MRLVFRVHKRHKRQASCSLFAGGGGGGEVLQSLHLHRDATWLHLRQTSNWLNNNLTSFAIQHTKLFSSAISDTATSNPDMIAWILVSPFLLSLLSVAKSLLHSVGRVPIGTSIHKQHVRECRVQAGTSRTTRRGWMANSPSLGEECNCVPLPPKQVRARVGSGFHPS